MREKEQFTIYTVFAVLTTCLGSFLFGYQTAVISGALPFLVQDFPLSPFNEGMVVSIILLGAILGVIAAGPLADSYGRKKAILLPALLFSMGAAIVFFSQSVLVFMLGRFVTGMAVGLISMTAPLYLAEISPSRYRGAFVCIHQLVVTLGILAAYIVNYHFADEGAWRPMFGLGLLPSLLQLILMMLLCDSPHWLLSKGQIDRAATALKKLRKDLLWKDHLKKPADPSVKDPAKWSSLFKKGMVRKVVILGLFLNMFQQITGINTVIYYAPKILQSAGFASLNEAIFASLSLGLINVLVTLLAVFLLDKLGRRILLMLGMLGMMASLLAISSAAFFHIRGEGLISLISLISYVAFFAIGIGPVTAVLVSEIYPLKIRGRAMGFVTTANWAFNYGMVLIFLDLLDALTAGGVFLLYAAISLICFLFVYRFIPETKGKSFEEIESSLQ